MLSYQPNAKPFHEFITVSPEGFRYRGNHFKSINAIFKWFKLHFNDRSTFPRTPGPTTPVSTSPYAAQRTPIVQSPYTNSTKQGFVSTPNINPQAIQRAAANMPSHIFNTLSQVTGQTPSLNPFGQTPSGSNAPSTNNFTVPVRPGFNQPPVHQLPSVATSHGRSSRLPFQPPSILPPTAMPPPPPPPVLSNRAGSRSGNQWADIIQQDWQQTNGQSGRSARSNMPRTPVYSTPGGSSQMSISPQQEEEATPNIRGDQTPLFDEWNNY